MTVTEPGLSSPGLRLLYDVRLHACQSRRAYPLCLNRDVRAAASAIAGGYLALLHHDPHFVTMTEKGDAYLDRLMRAT